MGRFRLSKGLIALVLASSPSSALALTSANFQVQTPTMAPAAAVQSSPNFQVSASVEPVVGSGSVSTNFTVPSGIIFPDPVAASTGGSSGGSGGGGGGGAGGLPASSVSGTLLPSPTGSTTSTLADPTLFYRPRTFKSVVRLQGGRPAAASVLVNGSDRDVRYPGEATWERTMPLFYGANLIRVQASQNGLTSPGRIGQPFRMLIGDVDGSRYVDDADLSLLSKAWRTREYVETADFNEDTVIDDADLSLMASHWNASY